jgi:hypothetical protein
MEAFSGYRIERRTQGKRVSYIAVLDPTKTYVSKASQEPTADDPMGAEVPDYILCWPEIRLDRKVQSDETREKRLADSTQAECSLDTILSKKSNPVAQPINQLPKPWWRRLFRIE